ncbi:WhiB family transcriptional regulator [Streptomyces sp. NPDC005576]|uniref:WhiB family transcriptional regulator n=1 Tax=Streptomyces sp. NPDC005576 TaxID=3364726 RepID=UPI0036A84CF0
MTAHSASHTTTSSQGETVTTNLTSSWRHHAACREEDPDLFFPIGTTGTAMIQTEEAKAVCHTCPVMETCLQWALDSNEETGVWGGLSEDERRRLRRRNTRAASKAAA